MGLVLQERGRPQLLKWSHSTLNCLSCLKAFPTSKPAATMEPYNVETGNYRDFINRVREAAWQPNRYSHGCPVLPHPQDPLQAETFDIQLVGRGGVSITVRIRRYDLYVIGYRQPNGQWWEFTRENNDGVHLIDNSQYIGFTESYTQMGGLINNDPWDVGYDAFLSAIDRLANPRDDRRHAMRAICVMVSEAVRSDKLLNHFADLMQRRVDSRFEAWMEALIHGWGDLSNYLLIEDHDATPFRLPPREDGRLNDLTTQLGIVTAADAAAALGLLLGTHHTDLVRAPRMATAATDEDVGDGGGIQGEGQPLVEVFSVRINNIDSEDPGDLYGTVKVKDGMGTYHLYNRASSDYESVKPDDTASLTGPYRAISFCHYFELSLDLWDHDTLSPDDPIGQGTLSWDYFGFSNYDYFNKRLFHIFEGEGRSSAMAYYTVFRDAVQAEVEVKLVNGDGEDPADVYGTLVARYSDQDYSTEEAKKYCQTTLFNKPKDKYIEVSPGEAIPLARFVVAVPTTASLVIEADLWDHDTISPDDQIARGTAAFSPQIRGQAAVGINGEDKSSILVTVTWSQASSK